MKYLQSNLARAAFYFLLGFIAFAIAAHLEYLESLNY